MIQNSLILLTNPIAFIGLCFTLALRCETALSKANYEITALESQAQCCELNYQKEDTLNREFNIELYQLSKKSGIGETISLSTLINNHYENNKTCTVISTGMRACPIFLNLLTDRDGYQQLELLRKNNPELAYLHVYTAEPHPTPSCNASAGGIINEKNPVSLPAHCTNNDRAYNANYVLTTMLTSYSTDEILIDPIQINPFMNSWGGSTTSPTAVALVKQQKNQKPYIVYSSPGLDTKELQDKINENCK